MKIYVIAGEDRHCGLFVNERAYKTKAEAEATIDPDYVTEDDLPVEHIFEVEVP
jgi:hypothetical protein